MEQEGDVIRRKARVRLSQPDAFRRFIHLGEWWPREYTWSGNSLRKIGIEPGRGGHCYELGPYEFRCDWGRVLVWEPPARLVITWQIGMNRVPQFDPDRASEVEIRFDAVNPDVTRVELDHRNFARHGEGADEYRDRMGSPEGWTYILGRYSTLAS